MSHAQREWQLEHNRKDERLTANDLFGAGCDTVELSTSIMESYGFRTGDEVEVVYGPNEVTIRRTGKNAIDMGFGKTLQYYMGLHGRGVCIDGEISSWTVTQLGPEPAPFEQLFRSFTGIKVAKVIDEKNAVIELDSITPQKVAARISNLRFRSNDTL